MIICIFLAIYVLIAGILYYRERKMMAMLEVYVRENMPISDGMLKLSFLFMSAILPVMVLINFIRSIFGSKKNVDIEDPDMRAFVEEYYPETLENVEQLTVVLDTIAEIEDFLTRIGNVFDKSLDPLECARVLALARSAQKDIDSNCRAYVTYAGRKVPLIFKVSRANNKKANFQIDIFTPCDVMDKLDVVTDEYIHDLERDCGS